MGHREESDILVSRSFGTIETDGEEKCRSRLTRQGCRQVEDQGEEETGDQCLLNQIGSEYARVETI
jgi:hypothetical protein